MSAQDDRRADLRAMVRAALRDALPEIAGHGAASSVGAKSAETASDRMGERISAAARMRFFRVGAVLVVLVGFQLGLRGLGALGVVEHLEVGGVVVW